MARTVDEQLDAQMTTYELFVGFIGGGGGGRVGRYGSFGEAMLRLSDLGIVIQERERQEDGRTVCLFEQPGCREGRYFWLSRNDDGWQRAIAAADAATATQKEA